MFYSDSKKLKIILYYGHENLKNKEKNLRNIFLFIKRARNLTKIELDIEYLFTKKKKIKKLKKIFFCFFFFNIQKNKPVSLI